MPTPRPRTQWALDSNFILNLEEGKEIDTAAWEIASKREVRLFAPDVVLGELDELGEYGQTVYLRSLARKATANLQKRWNVEPLVVSDLDYSIATRFGEECLERGLLPHEEKNDALLLGETAVRAIPFLVTSDTHLLSIDREALAVLCQKQDLPVVSILHPRSIVRTLG
jgi:hypothetical protein